MSASPHCLAAVAAALLLSAVPGIAAPPTSPKAAAENGRRLYLSVGCYQCHGTVGQGGAAGPRLAPAPMPLEALRAFIRNTTRLMPSYPASVLADDAVADIHAYLQSIPPAPRVESIPLLRAVK